jgi:hypothetical protein
MRSVILYRGRDFEKEEKSEAEKYFPCVSNRMNLKRDDLVIGRYSVLPFYKEQEIELESIGVHLINSFRQHLYVADISCWIPDLKDITPKTWRRLEDIPEQGPFVLKGETNSKKFQWDTHMFARNKREASEVHGRLCDDGLVGDQEIYIREYVPLVTYLISLRGLPITKEFRFFICDGKILSGAYYWSSHTDQLPVIPNPDEVPRSFLDKIINGVGQSIRFFVVDVAQAASGEWIVIELNDGQMSGLSLNEPSILYKNLFMVLNNEL